MATIYRAWDTTLERDVAVKVIHEHLADDNDTRERFRREAHHAAALVHPHIVTVYDQGIDALPNGASGTPRPYMVMELIDGPSLREVLQRQGRLTPAEVLAVVLPICDALARAHAAGVVHRDIKPENVLIGEGGVPKVADFGIAHAVSATRHTTTGTLIGSVHYMAPELARGHPASPASDQYAVGVLIFELLTGCKPLPAETPMAVVARHAQEPVPPPSRFVPDIPPALDRVVARATALSVSERFADVSVLAAALRSAVPSDPKVVPARQNLLRRWGRRRSWRWSGTLSRAVGLILLVALAAGLYLTDGPVRTVPSLEGLTRTDAARILTRLDYALVEDPAQPSRQVPEGLVLSQRPPPGTRLRRGEVVTVALSSGPAVVAMPRLLGLAEEEAREALARHGFTVTSEEGYSDTAASGIVDAQVPEAGAPIREGAGSEVGIHVSKGKEPVTVPDLSGVTRGEAQALLSRAKLRGTFTQESSATVPDGVVIRQSIDGGTIVDKGTTITVVLSRGQARIVMPDVRGRRVGEAKAALEAEGLVVRVAAQALPQIGPFRLGGLGVVVEQDPPPGQPVERGDTVTLIALG